MLETPSHLSSSHTQSANMSNFVLTEDKLLCCICLDVFRDPVTLQCGHNFCKTCIMEHLNFNSQRLCPMCKERVDKKYKLGVNTFISEMVLQFRQSLERREVEQREEIYKPGEVAPPTGPKSWLLLAFALTLLTIYLAFNLKLHQSLSSLSIDHRLLEAASSVCTEHHKPLELYCRNEQVPICRPCTDSAHRSHQVVPVGEEYKAKEAELQQEIQQRQQRIQEVARSAELSRDAADQEVAEGVRVFNALMETVEEAKAELVAKMEEVKKAKEEQAMGEVRELEQEILELRRKQAEVHQLSNSEDHLHLLLLWNFSSLKEPPPSHQWAELSVCPASYKGIIRMALVSGMERLMERVRREMTKLKNELKKRQQNMVDVTLDPDTAHPALVLSHDGKRVHRGNVWQDLPERAERFERGVGVVGKQSFSCETFYYDVQVTGNVGWTVGVAKQSVSRKEKITLNPDNGFWTICHRHRRGYFALDDCPKPLAVSAPPGKLRVFVDYDEGLVSFYDMDTSDLLFSFTGCSFTEKLLPFFSPGASDGGRNSAPLVISPVNQSG